MKDLKCAMASRVVKRHGSGTVGHAIDLSTLQAESSLIQFRPARNGQQRRH